MKRGGPLQRKAPLKSNSTLVSRTKLAFRSKKKTEQMARAREQLERLIKERGNRCEVADRFRKHGHERIVQDCRRRVEGRHHIVKQSAGGTDDDSNILLSCNVCNEQVENYPVAARLSGLA